MAEFKVELPKMGESVAEASSLHGWKLLVILLKKQLVEIATDKVDSEVPAPFWNFKRNIIQWEMVAVGSVFAIINSEEAKNTEPKQKFQQILKRSRL